MKTLELNLNKRLLIVEAESNFTADGNLKFICKGSELTEEIAKGLVESKVEHTRMFSQIVYKRYKQNISELDTYVFTKPLESFISAIEAQGYYWGENPIEEPHNSGLAHLYPSGDFLMDKSLEIAKLWQEYESKTFNPKKSLIFEIL